MGITVESTERLLTPLFPGRIGIWKCWFLRREENRSIRRKTLGAGTRTNNKLNPRMMPRPGIEPRPHWWEASALTTAPFLLLESLYVPGIIMSFPSVVNTVSVTVTVDKTTEGTKLAWTDNINLEIQLK